MMKLHGLAAVTALAAATAAPVASQEHPVDWQIAAAVLPLPDSARAAAQVLGYRDGKLVELRAGTGPMICLTDNPATKGFEASCYHRALEPFMARGRSLRAAGITERKQVDSARRADIRRGRLRMPTRPAALISVFSDSSRFDPAAGPPSGAGRLHVVYIPFATEANTGISATPSNDRPWLMYPGEPWSHIMIGQ